jgi:hypothetical protein
MISFPGYCESAEDAAMLIFCTLQEGSAKAHLVKNITRRLYAVERAAIGAGNCYVFNDRESGMKRWTDGMKWSKSRVLGQFLVYRRIDDKDDSQASEEQKAFSSAASTAISTPAELNLNWSQKKRKVSEHHNNMIPPPTMANTHHDFETLTNFHVVAGSLPNSAVHSLQNSCEHSPHFKAEAEMVSPPELASLDTTLVEEPALDHLITLPHQVSPSKLRRELNIIAAPNRLLAGIADELCKKTFSMVLHGTVYHVVWILD